MMSRLVRAGVLAAGVVVASTVPASAVAPFCYMSGLEIMCSVPPGAVLVVAKAQHSVPMPVSDEATAEVWESADLDGLCKEDAPRSGMSLVGRQGVVEGSQIFAPNDRCLEVYVKECSGINRACGYSFKVDVYTRDDSSCCGFGR